MAHPLLYTYDEAAELIGAPNMGVINRLLKSGVLIKVGANKSVRVNGESLRHFVARRDGMPADVKASGHIYLIQFLHYYKIGLSRNVKRRMQDISNHLPEPATLMHAIPTNNMRRGEIVLHTEYAHLRGRGEWFNLTPKEVKSICSIRALLFN